MNPLGDLQRAVFATATEAAAPAPVFDFVPEPTPFPYVTIGTAFTVPFNTHGSLGFQPQFDVDVWSKFRGMSEANSIAARLIAALNHRTLSVDNWPSPVPVWVTAVAAVRDPDPAIRRVNLTCRCWLQQPRQEAS